MNLYDINNLVFGILCHHISTYHVKVEHVRFVAILDRIEKNVILEMA